MTEAAKQGADLREWGWAPGGYVFKCRDCPENFSVADRMARMGGKRSWRCKEHAEAAREAMTTQTTPTPESVKALADGLTVKQREAVLKCTDQWLNAAEIGASGAVLAALCWRWPKGRDPLSPPICLLSRDYQDSPLRYIYRLTETGKQVAAHIGASHD